MEKVRIELGHTEYAIHIGRQLLGSKLLAQHCGREILVVTNDTVAPLYLDRVLAGLPTASRHVVLPDGEGYKELATLERIYEVLLQARFSRGCTLLALGGGVIGDMCGFAAATYQRGVACIQLPTTLLAQVDSSVGGKTGVNHQLGKNMIGAFHQPRAVFADMDTLDTLPPRELRAGLAEVIKHGFILDAEFLRWLETHIGELLDGDKQALAYAVRRSCEIKAAVVAADEREHGRRALLNFGHTFGHAIEAAVGYGNWLHGEAVGAGMAAALELSVRLKRLDPASAARGRALLERVGLPLGLPAGIDCEVLLEYMNRDKKVIDGILRFVLLDAIGSAAVVAEVPTQTLQNLLNDTPRVAHAAGATGDERPEGAL